MPRVRSLDEETLVWTDTSVGIAISPGGLLGWSFFGTPQLDWRIMSTRIPTLLATLSLGLFVLLFQPTLAEALPGCHVPNALSNHNGYPFARGLFVQVDRGTGKRVGAYMSTKVSGVLACTQVCEADANCTGVTFSGVIDRKCMRFAGYDFETKRPLSFTIYNGGGSGRSAKIRRFYHGPICSN